MARHRALVVDDNASLAQTVADLLTEEGFEVEVVDTGAGALATWRSRPADIVVIDVDLPDIDGLAVARRLSGRGRGCSLVVMSARDPQSVSPLCRELGATFVRKPFQPARLLGAVWHLLKARRVKARPADGERGARRLLGPRTPKGLLGQFRRWRTTK